MNNKPNLNLEFSAQRAAWINEQFVPENKIDLHVEEIKYRGYTLLENCYSESQLEIIRQKIEWIYKKQITEVGNENLLYEIGDANIARQLLAYDEYFLAYARNEKVLSIVKKLMGEHFILYQQNANFHYKNIAHTSTPWHRDLTFWHYTSSRPLAVSALLIVDDYTDNNGGLYVLPGTHKEEPFPSFEYVEANRQHITAKAGSIIVFDSMMFHAPGINQSEKVKRSMTLFYTMHLIRQEISLPGLLKGKWKNDDTLREFLGYNCMQQASVKQWRMEKFHNKRKTINIS